MSGIYIPGVSVPADDTVLLRVYHEENGYYFVERVDGIDQDFLGSYWAVSIPPHGRLIDADALMDQIEHDTPLSAVFEKTMRRYLHNAPTIIEAEEGE